jgi:hypothetical protein
VKRREARPQTAKPGTDVVRQEDRAGERRRHSRGGQGQLGCYVRVDTLEPKYEAPQARSQDRLEAGTVMAVTYYVALPFIRTEDGTAPGEAQECQSESAAIRRAEGMSRDSANAGAVAFKRSGDPNVGEFSDAVVLRKFGEVPEDLSEL